MAGLLRRAAPLARRLTSPHPLPAIIPIRPFRAAAYPTPSRALTKLPSAASARHPDLLRIARRQTHGDSSAVAGLEQRISRVEADLANHVSRLEVDLANNTARIEVYVDHKVVALEVKVEEVCLGRHKEAHAWHTTHAKELADLSSSILALKTAAHVAEVRAAENHVQGLREIGKVSWRVVWTVGLGAMTFTFGIIQVVRSESKTEYLRSADEQMRRHTQEIHKMFLEHLESTVQSVVELALAKEALLRKAKEEEEEERKKPPGGGSGGAGADGK